MAIFETLSIVFKADTSQLKKETDDVKKKTGEVTDTLKKSEDQTKKTDNEFSKLAGTLSKVAAGYFSIGAVVSGFKNALSNTTDIGNLSRTFGLDPQKADAYRKFIKNLGYDANAATTELLATSKELNQLPDVTLAALPAYGEALRKFPTIAQAQFAGQANGLGQETIAILYNTPNFNELLQEQIELGVVTPEDIERQREFSKSISKLENQFDELFRTLSVSVLPTIGLLATSLTSLLNGINSIIDPINKAFGSLVEEVSDVKEKAKKKGGSFIDPDNSFGKLSKMIQNDPYVQRIKNSAIFKYFTTPQTQEWKDLGGDYRRAKEKEESIEQHQSLYIPTSIPSVSNSQASTISFGDVHVNTTAQDAKGIASGIVGELGNQSKPLLAQLQQSFAYFDDGMVI